MAMHRPNSARTSSNRPKLLALAPGHPGGALVVGNSAHGRDLEAACTGTYFIQESNGSANLWTIHRDGTLVNASLGERGSNFSTQHGTWKFIGTLQSKALQLDFHWTPEGGFASVGRVDITIHGQDRSCKRLAGEAEGRLFEMGEDSQNPETDTGDAFAFSFSGFRVEVPD